MTRVAGTDLFYYSTEVAPEARVNSTNLPSATTPRSSSILLTDGPPPPPSYTAEMEPNTAQLLGHWMSHARLVGRDASLADARSPRGAVE